MSISEVWKEPNVKCHLSLIPVVWRQLTLMFKLNLIELKFKTKFNSNQTQANQVEGNFHKQFNIPITIPSHLSTSKFINHENLKPDSMLGVPPSFHGRFKFGFVLGIFIPQQRWCKMSPTDGDGSLGSDLIRQMIECACFVVFQWKPRMKKPADLDRLGLWIKASKSK